MASMHPVSDWIEDRAEAERLAAVLRRTVRYATARVRIAHTVDSYGRKHYRIEADR